MVANALPTRLMALLKAPTPTTGLEPFEQQARPVIRVETPHLARAIAIESDAVGVAPASQIAQDAASERLRASVPARRRGNAQAPLMRP